MPDSFIAAGEPDAWFARNKNRLTLQGSDYPLKLLFDYGLRPQRVLEVGGANGFRLDAIHRWYGSECVNIEPSEAALKDGRERYPNVLHFYGKALYLREHGIFDCIIASFILHWLPREQLLSAVAEIDQVLLPGGYLVLADFAPDHPCAVPYKHRDGLFTYKQPYHELWLSSYSYRLAAYLEWDHDSHELSANVPADRRAFCALLRKQEEQV